MDNGLINLAFLLIGGLGLFLLGMHFTSDGLQKLAGAKMKKIMTGLTHNRVVGAVTGAGMTAVLQSSSFMSVMVVGLVSAKLLNLAQAASLIVGMNVGTTITAQIIAFQVSAFALPIIALGVYLHLFTKEESYHFGGQTMLGIGMLFLGLAYMKDAFAPLKDNPAFFDFFINFSDNILLAVLVGVLSTVLIQASAGIIGISMALASAGMIDFAAAIAIVLGSNIGTTITAQIAAFKMNRTAKRAALFHTIFNVVGVVLVLFVFRYFVGLIDVMTPNEADFFAEDGSRPYIARHIANAHTIFNLASMVIFLFVLPYLVKLVEWVIPKKPETRLKGMFTLNKAYLKAPDIALMQVKLACTEMTKVVKENLKMCKNYPKEHSKLQAKIFKNEDLINAYRKDISNYLGKVSRADLTEKQAQEVPVFLHLVNDIEAMADELKKIVEVLNDLIDKDKNLTESERKTFERLMKDLSKYVSDILSLMRKSSRNKVIALEEELIDFRRKKLDTVNAKHGYMSDIMHSFHDFTRKVANILIMTREI